ncbi:FadR family transcriptional regulator [Skermanella sp. TT6]|uniref:FadR family transcriptional regulator n=1 Tax=Skermanella cutis TaxID=2775420 RepID=A0ABX7BBK2_9PROT|nr:FadR/GntR family transcriptional regulator [Skermanella sp. TT6]QQP91493.1 FadR family transcriptional regulator [Skermanella sp. TT6]
MPIQTVETQRLYQQVAGQLGDLIRRGEFPPGHRLPPERDLARQLGVSRPTVREAMIALEIAGLVEVRTGSGAYVRKAPQEASPPFSAPDIGPSPFDLIAARLLIEPEIASAAAACATPDDLASIAEALDRMREGVDVGQDVRPADRLFHARIARATGNSVLASMVDRLWRESGEPIFDGLSRRTGLPENHRTSLAEHARILDALGRRDGPAARDAMREHLAGVERIMLAEDWPATGPQPDNQGEET